MPQGAINFNELSTAELRSLYDQLVVERGEELSRTELVQRIAVLRTRKPLTKATKRGEVKTAPARKQPIRDAILKTLAVVSHYEHAVSGDVISKKQAACYPGRLLESVGLPYDEVLARVKEQFPDARISNSDLRWNANQVRNRAAGFENCILPDKRARA